MFEPFPMTQFSDFCETVTLVRPSSGQSMRIQKATQINPGKSETGFLASTSVPHVKTVWFLTARWGFEPQRGDRITDKTCRTWIIVEPVPYGRFNTWRCRCVHETLQPGPDDYADLFRMDSLNGQTAGQNQRLTLVAPRIAAIVYDQSQKSVRDNGLPIKKIDETIVFQVKTNADLTAADILRRKKDAAVYEIISRQFASLYSDWGQLTARRVVGDHGLWVFPNTHE